MRVLDLDRFLFPLGHLDLPDAGGVEAAHDPLEFRIVLGAHPAFEQHRLFGPRRAASNGLATEDVAIVIVEDLQFQQVARQLRGPRLLLLQLAAGLVQSLTVMRDQLGDRPLHAFETDGFVFHGAQRLLHLFRSLVERHDQTGLAVARRADLLQRRAQLGELRGRLRDVLRGNQPSPAGDAMEPADLLDGRIESLPRAERIQRRLRGVALVGEPVHAARNLLRLVEDIQRVLA